MKLRVLLFVNAIVLGASGLFAIIFPGSVLLLYGVSPGPSANLMAQYAGLGSMAIGLIAWLNRDIGVSQARRSIIPAFLITYAAGVIISVLGTVSGIMKIGWGVVGLYLLFALCYGYFQFSKKK